MRRPWARIPYTDRVRLSAGWVGVRRSFGRPSLTHWRSGWSGDWHGHQLNNNTVETLEPQHQNTQSPCPRKPKPPDRSFVKKFDPPQVEVSTPPGRSFDPPGRSSGRNFDTSRIKVQPLQVFRNNTMSKLRPGGSKLRRGAVETSTWGGRSFDETSIKLRREGVETSTKLRWHGVVFVRNLHAVVVHILEIPMSCWCPSEQNHHRVCFNRHPTSGTLFFWYSKTQEHCGFRSSHPAKCFSIRNRLVI